MNDERQKRLGQVRPPDVEGLTSQLRTAVRRSDLWRLASNPLLLTVMALVHTHKGRLGVTRNDKFLGLVLLGFLDLDGLKGQVGRPGRAIGPE